MKNVPDTPMGRKYKENIRMILEKDIDSLLDQYTDDAVLISSFTKRPVVFRGRDEIRSNLQGMMGVEGLETEIVFWGETESPQTVMFTEQVTMKIPDAELHMRFANSWVLRDGKIAIHFAGMVQYPDGSLA